MLRGWESVKFVRDVKQERVDVQTGYERWDQSRCIGSGGEPGL